MDLPPTLDIEYAEFLKDDRYTFVDWICLQKVDVIKDNLTGKEMVAKCFLKLKKICPKLLQKRLEQDTRPLTMLEDVEGVVKMYSVGLDFFLMEKLGKTLDNFIKAMNTKTVLHLTDQLLTRLEQIHTRGILHLDIKPQNIAIGFEQQMTFHLIDFGVHRIYRPERMLNMKIPKIDESGFNGPGSIDTMSLNTHHGGLKAPRDDLESMAYVFIWMAAKDLPWSKYKFNGQEPYYKYGDVCYLKKYFELPDGCHTVFLDFLMYARSLTHLEMPNYEGWRRRFREVMNSEEFAHESVINFTDADGHRDYAQCRRDEEQEEHDQAGEGRQRG